MGLDGYEIKCYSSARIRTLLWKMEVYMVLVHFLLGVVTGGIWWIILLIRYITKKR